VADFFPVKSSMGDTSYATARTSQKMYMVNLSMLITVFMAILDTAARLTDIHKFWPKDVDPACRSWCVHQKQHGRKTWPCSDDLAEGIPFFTILRVSME